MLIFELFPANAVSFSQVTTAFFVVGPLMLLFFLQQLNNIHSFKLRVHQIQ